jgi:uncharacterized flavoprotein (TIGR03862 family)
MKSAKQRQALSVAIIGGGPSGLMAAEVLIKAGYKVDLYEVMPTVGRKFLMAGKGGMNISNDEPIDVFMSRYGSHRSYLKEAINRFSTVELRQWLYELGIETFVGSSGRVFPSDMKAAPLLRKWLSRLRSNGVNFHLRHQWIGWADGCNHKLIFNAQGGRVDVNVDAVILALGGASWPQLGSTGAWVSILEKQEVIIAPLQAANCGFDVIWSDYFGARYSGKPLKSISISSSIKEFDGCHKGELLITEYGLEGGVIYTLSSRLREEITLNGYAMIYLDLIPCITKATAVNKITQDRGKQSMANHLRKQLGINGVKAGLLREIVIASDFSNVEQLCTLMKSLPIKLVAARPISEAISTAGGIEFTELDQNLMLVKKPGVFCTGEMLDWEAPTGGYLLTACLSLGRAAGMGVISSLE